MIRRVLVIPEHLARSRLDRALSELDDSLSRTAIKRLLEEGRVFLGDLPLTGASRKVCAGETITLEVPEPEALVDVRPEAIPLAVVYEDGDLIVIDKPAGMVVHPGAGVTGGTLVNALLHHCGDLSGIGGVIRPGIVHRLDKETSGLLVAAKHDLAHRGLAEQFKEHTAFRRYLALVKGAPKPERGTISAPIGRHRVERQRMAVVREGGREAITHYATLERLPAFTLVECRLETGRTHQIRVHMAHLGHPLLGDPVYGRPFQPPRLWPEEARAVVTAFRRQALHGAALEFTHPMRGERLSFSAPLPDDFSRLLEALRTL